MKKIFILIEDDWELKGNGLGNVADLQYLPALFLMKLAGQLNLKINFMVEVLQQIAFKNYADIDRNLKIQTNIWDECVLMMKEKGHDVQLHIHPQWYKCVYRDGFFRLSNNWNIATYTPKERNSMIFSGISYLKQLIKPIDPNYKVIAFKAGSWAIQPSFNVLTDLVASGIRIVIAPGRGISYITNNIYINYEDIQNDILPYYPDFQNIQYTSNKKESLAVIPLPFYTRHWLGIFKSLLIRIFKHKIDLYYYMKIDDAILEISPMSQKKSVIQKIYSFFAIHSFDISTAPFEELKFGLDQIISKALQAPGEIIPIILQSHTKGYINNVHNIRKFFYYLIERYGNYIVPTTFSEFLPYMDQVTITKERN